MILDLGLDDKPDDGGLESYLERDSPKLAFGRCSDQPVSEAQAMQVGKILTNEKCISLVFLLIGNSAKALQLCKEVRV